MTAKYVLDFQRFYVILDKLTPEQLKKIKECDYAMNEIMEILKESKTEIVWRSNERGS